MRLVGVGYRRQLHEWLATLPSEVEMLELTAEHFFEGGFWNLRSFRKLPKALHGLGLSFGTPGELDAKVLKSFRRVVDEIDPLWISEHVAFTRTREVDLGHLTPLAPTRANLELVSNHASEVMQVTGKHLLLENITSFLSLEGDFEEPEFLNEICRRSGAGLLLDVTNLYINSRNHRFDPLAYFSRLNPELIQQLHVVGYFQGEFFEDRHADAIQEDLMSFTLHVLEHCSPRGVIIERDSHFPAPQSLCSELWRLKHGT